MEIPIEVIYTVVASLAGAIVFMAGGFIYIYRKMEVKLDETEGLLKKYIKAYSQLEVRYKEISRDHHELLDEHRTLSARYEVMNEQ